MERAIQSPQTGNGSTPRVELLVIEAAFQINNRIILVPDFSVPEGWTNRMGTIVVATPDGRRFEATGDFHMAHLQVGDPVASIDQRWRIIVSIPQGRKDDFPIGSRILVSPELRGTVLPGAEG
jgi:hypothetical protein